MSPSRICRLLSSFPIHALKELSMPVDIATILFSVPFTQGIQGKIFVALNLLGFPLKTSIFVVYMQADKCSSSTFLDLFRRGCMFFVEYSVSLMAVSSL